MQRTGDAFDKSHPPAACMSSSFLLEDLSSPYRTPRDGMVETANKELGGGGAGDGIDRRRIDLGLG
jgi:hypothetical protein